MKMTQALTLTVNVSYSKNNENATEKIILLLLIVDEYYHSYSLMISQMKLKDIYMIFQRIPLNAWNVVIKLTQKERKLKIDGRMFGQSPAYERLRRVIQEKHVSKAFKYNTHQSLTTSELDRIS